MNDYIPTKIEIKFVEDEKLKAVVCLKFGKMVIRGFRVMVGKYDEDFWVVPPSYYNHKSRKYHTIFFIDDKEIWSKIQKMILSEMDKQLAKTNLADNTGSVTTEEIEQMMNS